MSKRFVAIWFRSLKTDHALRKRPELKGVPFVLAAAERGRMMVKAASAAARNKGIEPGMVVADSRAILPHLQVFNDDPALADQLLHALAEWCLRYTPVAAIDPPEGLLLDVSGCTHLWGGEAPYLEDIIGRLATFGYDVRAAMADTIGTAWAVSRFGRGMPVIERGGQAEALSALPPAALRLDASILERLEKLGFYQVGRFMGMPRSVLRRRFGTALLQRLDHALGQEAELLQPIQPIPPYQERLPSLEPIRTAAGIEIALRRLLEALCGRLTAEEKGLRTAVFKGYRMDGHMQQIAIGTNKASRSEAHLFRLFDLKIATMEPALGFELFVLEATVVEDMTPDQEMLWDRGPNGDDTAIAELLDRLGGRVGMAAIHRYLPTEHYWPERSVRLAASLGEAPQTAWRVDRQRPVHLLSRPEEIEVTVPIPDYPPMLFKYKGKLYRVARADGPERIEREWWLEQGEHRDYYCVEDEDGGRYWLFRLGHYASSQPQWFIHGFFA